VDRPKHLTVILNPAASSGRGGKLYSRIEAGLTERNIPFTLRQSASRGHAEDLAREAAASGADLILVVGGDGTIHEVANGILKGDGPPPPIAVVPVGTGNDFFRMVAGKRDVEAVLDSLLEGSERSFDVGHARFGGKDAYFVNLLGVGVDVEVLRRREGFPRLKGLPQYLAALVSALATFRPFSVQVTIHDEANLGEPDVLEDRTILMAMTVGPSVGGGFMLNPDATPYDGLLDLFFVKTLGMLKLARYIPKVIRGTHQGVPELLQRQITAAEVRRTDGEAFFFEMDGETMPDPVTEVEVGICPKVLRVVVPQGAN